MSPHDICGKNLKFFTSGMSLMQKTSPYMQNLCYFIEKISFVKIYALCRDIHFVAIYALLCGEKFIQQISSWRKWQIWGLAQGSLILALHSASDTFLFLSQTTICHLDQLVVLDHCNQLAQCLDCMLGSRCDIRSGHVSYPRGHCLWPTSTSWWLCRKTWTRSFYDPSKRADEARAAGASCEIPDAPILVQLGLW